MCEVVLYMCVVCLFVMHCFLFDYGVYDFVCVYSCSVVCVFCVCGVSAYSCVVVCVMVYGLLCLRVLFVCACFVMVFVCDVLCDGMCLCVFVLM